MKAVILVGGEGTRLRPLTCNMPKAIVPILNKPFLEHLLSYLRKHGIEEVILAVGYNPKPIRDCLGDGSRLGVRIHYLMEESPLGTAGAVKNAEPLLDDTFVVFNGDILTEIDLTAMIKRHREVQPKVSIALTPVDNPTIYGVVETDAQGMVKRFLEKPGWDKVTSNMINAGIYILEYDVLKYIPVAEHSMFERHIFPRLIDIGEPLLSYSSNDYWVDIGAPDKYLKAHHDMLLRWNNKEVRAAETSRIHPEAILEGPLLIADGCTIAAGARLIGPTVLGSRCEIGKNTVIEGSVLWDGSRVKEGAILKDCILGAGCSVHEGCSLPEGSVLGDKVTVPKGSKLAPGARLWPDGHAETASPAG